MTVRSLLGWLIAFASLLVTKAWALSVPATWDASWTVFAGGSTLAENGFDLGALLASPPFYEYGPGTHATSPVVWMTGLIIRVVGQGALLLPTLHIVHFAIGAVAIQQIYRFARGVWAVAPSLVATATIILLPVVNAQFGTMYLEVPQLAAMMLAVNAFFKGETQRAGAWAAVGTSVKASGIIVPLALAATALTSDRGREVIRKAVWLVLPSAGILTLTTLANPGFGVDERGLAAFLRGGVGSLLGTPDIALVFGLALIFVVSAARSGRLTASERPRLVLGAWMVGGFLATYFLLPVLGMPFVLLPRYFALVAPFAVVGAGLALRAVFGAWLMSSGAALLIAVSIANSSGGWYLQPRVNNTIYQEHSNGNAQLLLATQAGFAKLEQMRSIPIVVDRNQWFRGTYPAAGYVDVPLPNMVRLEDHVSGDSFINLPREFVVLDAESAGSSIDQLVEHLRADPRWEDRPTPLHHGRFDVTIHQFVYLGG